MKFLVLVVFILNPLFLFAEDFTYELYLPRSKISQVPLLVALHGCDQTSSVFRKESQLDLSAEQSGFAVLYPNQISGRNKIRCWNWYQRDPKQPNSIEADEIVAMIGKARVANPRLTGNVYVTGLSSGGALAGYLAACYPSIFKAAAIHSGVSFMRADNESDGLRLMQQGQRSNFPPAHTCAGFRRTPTLVIQGGVDTVVHTSNSKLILDDMGERNKSYLIWVPDLAHAWSGGAPGKYSNSLTSPASVAIFRFLEDLER